MTPKRQRRGQGPKVGCFKVFFSKFQMSKMSMVTFWSDSGFMGQKHCKDTKILIIHQHLAFRNMHPLPVGIF